MGKRTIGKYILVLLLSAFVCVSIVPSGIWAQKLTHTVKKGDTLWDICEKYYGDPNLWPKLWQMNGFITNPHLLEPGDVITLFEREAEAVEEVKEPEVVAEPEPIIEEEPEPKVMGISLEGRTNTATLGFLSSEEILPWGILFASENERIIFGEDDTVFVLFDEDKEIKVGDMFSIGRSSDLLKHPITGKDLGYTFLVNGSLEVEERLDLAQKDDEFYQKKNVFKARIIEAYEPVYLEDKVIPYQSISSCILPVPMEGDIRANIVATKAQTLLIHPNSIVYIDAGSKDGIRIGNVFDIVKGNVVSDPEPENKFYLLKKSKIILPDNLIGRIMIIESMPENSTAIVLSASEPFSPGVYVTNLSWEEMPDFLASKADCPIE